MEAKKIAIILPNLGVGGAERSAILLSKELSLEYNVNIIVFYPVNVWNDPISLNSLDFSKSRIGFVNLLRIIFALRRKLKHGNYNKVISFMTITNIIVLLSTWGMHFIRVYICDRTSYREEKLHLVFRVLRRWLYPVATGHIVQTEAASNYFKNNIHSQSNISVIPNFTTYNKGQKYQGSGGYWIAIGRLINSKNFVRLIESYSRLNCHIPLIILGDGPCKEQILETVCNLGLQGRIRVLTDVIDTQPYIAGASVYLSASLREGFPNSLLECMACGVPGVVFNCEFGPSEIITHGVDGILVPVDVHCDKLIFESIELTENRERLIKMSQQASLRANTFTSTKIKEKWIHLLSDSI